MSTGAEVLPAFEVLRFDAVSADAGVAVLLLAGRFVSGSPGGVPRLLVEQAGRAREVAPVQLDAADGDLRAAFAVPADALGEGGAAFSLVVGRGPLIALPAPTAPEGPEADAYVRLARVANELRRRLAAAESRAAQAEDRAEEGEAAVREAAERVARAEAAAQAAEREADEAAERIVRAEAAAAAAAREADERAVRAEAAAVDAAREADERADRAEAAAAAEVVEAVERAERAEEAAAAADRDADEAAARAERAEGELRDAREHADRSRGEAVDALGLVRELEDRVAAAEAEFRAERDETRAVARPGGLFAAPDPAPEPTADLGAGAAGPPADPTAPTDPITPFAARRALRPVRSPGAVEREVVDARTPRTYSTPPRLLPRLLALGALLLLVLALVLVVLTA